MSEAIESFRSELDAKIESVRTELNAKIESVRAELSARIDRLEAKVDSHFRWLFGTVLAMWVSVILAIVCK